MENGIETGTENRLENHDIKTQTVPVKDVQISLEDLQRSSASTAQDIESGVVVLTGAVRAERTGEHVAAAEAHMQSVATTEGAAGVHLGAHHG
jgi:hypothetical protein